MNLNKFIKAVGDEPELEDDMPEEMWSFISESKENATIAMRHIVKLTKAGIIARILKEARDEQG